MRKKSNAGHGRREPGMLGSRRQRLRERTLLSSDLNRNSRSREDAQRGVKAQGLVRVPEKRLGIPVS